MLQRRLVLDLQSVLLIFLGLCFLLGSAGINWFLRRICKFSLFLNNQLNENIVVLTVTECLVSWVSFNLNNDLIPSEANFTLHSRQVEFEGELCPAHSNLAFFSLLAITSDQPKVFCYNRGHFPWLASSTPSAPGGSGFVDLWTFTPVTAWGWGWGPSTMGGPGEKGVEAEMLPCHGFIIFHDAFFLHFILEYIHV